MVSSEVPAEMMGIRSTFLKTVVSLVLGIVMGVLTYYVTVLAVTAPFPSNLTINPLTLAMSAIVGALAVAIGWHRPLVGLTAGIVIIAVVAWAVTWAATGRIVYSPANATGMSPFNAVAFGAVSVAPIFVGATMATVSALRLHSPRTGS
ncbi:hypothetical protein [Cryobacterium sp. TMT1-66-1]|uniref:hypothetical protein n=1 Tax=Cryobacterium sp. TMT1-66-1 TaxID=1259242 RepID=UPI001F541B29|nr:hypothetical protein [Cryobacterium sp. TMT1-66-1]